MKGFLSQKDGSSWAFALNIYIQLGPSLLRQESLNFSFLNSSFTSYLPRFSYCKPLVIYRTKLSWTLSVSLHGMIQWNYSYNKMKLLTFLYFEWIMVNVQWLNILLSQTKLTSNSHWAWAKLENSAKKNNLHELRSIKSNFWSIKPCKFT